MPSGQVVVSWLAVEVDLFWAEEIGKCQLTFLSSKRIDREPYRRGRRGKLLVYSMRSGEHDLLQLQCRSRDTIRSILKAEREGALNRSWAVMLRAFIVELRRSVRVRKQRLLRRQLDSHVSLLLKLSCGFGANVLDRNLDQHKTSNLEFSLKFLPRLMS